MKRIAVVLSGCGFKDGSEITESVSTLIALSGLNTDYQCYSPSIDFTSTNHLDNSESETRNTLTESARITRGNVKDIKELTADNYDGIVFPGGYGVTKHLCNFAEKGAACNVDNNVDYIIKSFHSQSKPIGAFCIAPALIAKVLGEHEVAVTIGNDKETALEIEKTGAQHVDCLVDDFVTDRLNKVITTPAYMLEESANKVFIGINKALTELVEMA